MTVPQASGGNCRRGACSEAGGELWLDFSSGESVPSGEHGGGEFEPGEVEFGAGSGPFTSLADQSTKLNDKKHDIRHLATLLFGFLPFEALSLGFPICR